MTRTIVDWIRIIVLPLWLAMTLSVWPHPTWLVVVETAIVTLLVTFAVERRIR